jgi:hypothetical protein
MSELERKRSHNQISDVSEDSICLLQGEREKEKSESKRNLITSNSFVKLASCF